MKIKFLLTVFLIINFINLIKSTRVIFNDQINCLTTPCQWNDTSSWIGGILPKQGDDVVINIGSRSTVVVDLNLIKDIIFNSFELGSNLNVNNKNQVNGTISNVIVNGNLNINCQFVWLSNITGSGVITYTYQDVPNPSSSSFGKISLSNFNTLNIIGLINVEVTNSKIIEIIQSNLNGSTQFADQPTVTFLGDNTIGSIQLLNTGINFYSGSNFILNGSQLSTFGKKVNESNSSSSSNSSSLIKSTQFDQQENLILNYQISILNTRIISYSNLSIVSTSKISIESSTINSNLIGDSGSLSLSGLNTIDGNLNLTGTSLTLLSDHIQTNIEESLSFGPKTTFNTLGNGSPLITVSRNTILKGSLTIFLTTEPINNKKYTLIKSIGNLSGNFSSFLFQINSQDVDSSLFTISTENGAYTLLYGTPDNNSSLTLISNYLLLLIILLISIFLI
ncbi:hypothetical protein RB653_006186 [Dictyostelium firmibasis]|uniref:Uncharacterized protein n=1 Tax=Dictyostelium firmibasis TaxID=79012 RepID=A0AAN7U8J2_9MYCE